ncbi:MAG: E3 binding domain-containing protein, partial [Trueperaceae bacterium]|nr:E3 binding domain-containing protein [Trueperaceae bacterium]
MAEFRMPSLGADMDAGRLLEWYVKPGDAVHRGDIVALVDTDKAAIEVEIFDEGVVGELLIEPGTTVPVGTAMARIEGEGAARPAAAAVAPTPVEVPPAAAPAAAPAAEVPVAAPPTEAPAAPAPVAAPPTEAPLAVTPVAVVPAAPPVPAAAPLRATPSARAHARELELDLADVRGTGRHGLITHADVIAAGRLRERPVAEAVPAPAPPAPA